MTKIKKGQKVKLTKEARTGIGTIIPAGTELRVTTVGKNGYFCSDGHTGMYIDRSVLEGSIEVKERKKKEVKE